MALPGSIHPREFYKFFEDLNGDVTVRVGGSNCSTRADTTSTENVVYVGSAPIGSATSAAVWQIVKWDYSGEVVSSYADGDASFDNVWDDRVGLSYS